MNPRNLRGDDECLEAGLLQMADGSWVGVDLRGVGEGMLDDTGENITSPWIGVH